MRIFRNIYNAGKGKFKVNLHEDELVALEIYDTETKQTDKVVFEDENYSNLWGTGSVKTVNYSDIKDVFGCIGNNLFRVTPLEYTMWCSLEHINTVSKINEYDFNGLRMSDFFSFSKKTYDNLFPADDENYGNLMNYILRMSSCYKIVDNQYLHIISKYRLYIFKIKDLATLTKCLTMG